MDVSMTYAKKKFADTLKQLMKQKTLKEVRVREIVELSGLSRQSFYNNFQDKYELAKYVWESETFHMIKAYEADKGLYKLSMEIMKIMLTNPSFYQNLLKDIDDQNSFYSFWVKMSVAHLAGQLSEVLQSEQSLITAIKMYTYGSIMCIREWINDSDRDAPEIVCHYIVNSIPAVLTPYIRY